MSASVYTARARGAGVHTLYTSPYTLLDSTMWDVGTRGWWCGTIWGRHKDHMQVVYRESTLSLYTCIQERVHACILCRVAWMVPYGTHMGPADPVWVPHVVSSTA